MEAIRNNAISFLFVLPSLLEYAVVIFFPYGVLCLPSVKAFMSSVPG
jgi:hypothetical protein